MAAQPPAANQTPISAMPVWLRVLLGLAAFVVVVAGMKAAVGIIVPFLLALFLAVISAPALFWLQKKGIPPVAAIVIITLLMLAAGSLVGSMLAQSIPSLVKSLPDYGTRFQQSIADTMVWLQAKGVHIDSARVQNIFKPDTAVKMLGSLFSQLGALTAEGIFIFMMLVLILLEAATFEAKFRTAFHQSPESIGRLYHIVDDVKRYLAVKTTISLITAVLITIWLMILKVDYAIVWGLLTFVLTFVPNIGAVLSAVPPTIVALIQLGGTKAALTAGGYVVVCGILGNFLELLWMGQKLGLSTLVVFLSLTVWGWVLGPVGMLLSVPLTMTAKIILQSNDDTRWIAILLGSAPGQPKPKIKK